MREEFMANGFFDDDYELGYSHGYKDAENHFQLRINKLYIDILELNARIDHLETLMEKKK